MPRHLSLSPISHLIDPILDQNRINIYMKRDDLIAGACQGNKMRKLKYQVGHLPKINKPQILTFGGAFSNHLYAVAAYGAEVGIETIGIIRGEFDLANPTLKKIRQWGMLLHFVSRSEYSQRNEPAYLRKLQEKFPFAHIIPEGGNHPDAYPGIIEMVNEIRVQHPETIHYWVCPYGTGSTAAGIARGLKKGEMLSAFVVLKGLKLAAEKARFTSQPITFHEAHYGGYAKRCKVIEDFIMEFHARHDIILDPIYTGRMMHALYQQIHQNKIKPGSNIMVIHTGGYQGIIGYNYRFGTDLPVAKAH
ncbi:MAG: pyridoxal-phosphate dependent enzyme [Saprospiraceae bacterium]|nr:pyridoxal-phosphate dependent enzyme [Saprospiraceae bacterium]